MFCPSCGMQLEAAVKFCPGCGAAQQQPAAQPQPQAQPLPGAGLLGALQAKLAEIPVVGTVQQRLDALPVPDIALGAGGSFPAAAAPDLVWTAALLLGTLLGFWFMKWWLWPVFLAAGALAVIYGVRPGVSVMVRSVLFLAAGFVASFALFVNDAYSGLATLGNLLFILTAGRGIWGVIKDGLPGGDAFRMSGRRLIVAFSALGVALIGCAMKWEADYGWMSMGSKRVGTIYTDGAGRVVQDSTYYLPDPQWHTIEGGQGSGAAVGALVLIGLLILFRNKPWPRWMKIAVTVCLGWNLAYVTQGMGRFLGLGVILYTAAMGVLAWSMLSRKAG